MKFSDSAIFSQRNRGILLDAGVFLVSGLLLGGLSFRLNNIVQMAKGGDFNARVIMVFYVSAICILPGLGATLKFFFSERQKPGVYAGRWQGMFRKVMGITLVGQFLAFSIFLMSGVFMRKDMGADLAANSALSGLFRALFVLSLVFALANLVFVYLYFSVPKLNFGLKSEIGSGLSALGDLVIFLNMLLYQAFWGILMTDLTRDYTGIFDRIFTLLFSAVLIYLPPRLFFLAEDGHRPLTWVFILLANLPLILRIFFS